MSESTAVVETQQSITVTRLLDAPCDVVYNAWVTPEHFAFWFGARLEVPMDTVAMDVTEGGHWKATMISDDADKTPMLFAGVYRELVPNERIVMTFDDPENVDAGTNEKIQLLTVTFTDVDGKTRIELTQEGLMGESMPAGLTHGYGTFLDKLEELLAS